jgi:hypothetical protein
MSSTCALATLSPQRIVQAGISAQMAELTFISTAFTWTSDVHVLPHAKPRCIHCGEDPR